MYFMGLITSGPSLSLKMSTKKNTPRLLKTRPEWPDIPERFKRSTCLGKTGRLVILLLTSIINRNERYLDIFKFFKK